METEGAGEEGAGADETAGEEAAKAAAAEAGEGSGDRTDDPEAAGAPDTLPEMPEVADKTAADLPQPEASIPPVPEMAASVTEELPSTVTPDMPDISHIPADPTPGQTVEQPDSATLSIRRARANGTDAHLPVLQALADRLDALAVQMNRSGRS